MAEIRKPRAERPKRTPQITPAFQPAGWELADISAVQALERGTATPEQQKRVLRWFLYEACRLGDVAFRPGEDGRRDTDFALGRMFPAQQTVKLLRLNLAALPRDARADPHDETARS